MQRHASLLRRQRFLKKIGATVLFGSGIGLGFVLSPNCLVLTRRPGEDEVLSSESVGYNHAALLGDQSRVDPYATAIKRFAAGRRAVDIGTGPVCLLARMCLKAGAQSADAVEYSKSMVQSALSNFNVESQGDLDFLPESARLSVRDISPADEARCTVVNVNGHEGPEGSSQELRLYEGLSTDPSLALRGGYNLVVHELLGDMAGAEGAAAVIADIRARGLVTQDCVFIPRCASTLIAPTIALRRTPVELFVHFLFHRSSRIELLERYKTLRFHKGALLAEPQALEVLDFQGGPEMLQHRDLEFRTDYEGLFDGLHMHLHVDLDGTEMIDVLDLHSDASGNALNSWNTAYVRILEEPIALPARSRIVLRCQANLGNAVLGEMQTSSGLVHYAIEVAVGERGSEQHVASLEWRGG